LALSVLGISSLAAGATLDRAPAVRANLDGDAFVAAQAPAPRRIRRSLDDAANSIVKGASGNAASSLDDNEASVVPPRPRRVFRVSLDEDRPAFAGRLIRLSIDEGRTVYGRLSEGTWQGRRLRTTLD
jgi:hypothetical protein